MSRYIDADSLKKMLGDWIREHWTEAFTGDDAGSEFMDMINHEETIDTAKAVHAHWIGPEIKNGVYKGGRIVLCDRNGYIADGPCECSNCGSVLIGSDEYAVKGRYCPNCGAKMDEY